MYGFSVNSVGPTQRGMPLGAGRTSFSLRAGACTSRPVAAASSSWNLVANRVDQMYAWALLCVALWAANAFWLGSLWMCMLLMLCFSVAIAGHVCMIMFDVNLYPVPVRGSRKARLRQQDLGLSSANLTHRAINRALHWRQRRMVRADRKANPSAPAPPQALLRAAHHSNVAAYKLMLKRVARLRRIGREMDGAEWETAPPSQEYRQRHPGSLCHRVHRRRKTRRCRPSHRKLRRASGGEAAGLQRPSGSLAATATPLLTRVRGWVAAAVKPSVALSLLFLVLWAACLPGAAAMQSAAAAASAGAALDYADQGVKEAQLLELQKLKQQAFDPGGLYSRFSHGIQTHLPHGIQFAIDSSRICRWMMSVSL